MGLPPAATEDSHIRYKIAQELANLASPSFGQESVLTGSASRGVADKYSDIEMMFYVDALPAQEDRETWLRFAGASDIVFDTESPGDSEVWAAFYISDISVEAGWRVITEHEKDIDAIVAGKVVAHGLLTLAWIMTHAVSLRSIGHLPRWQQKLSHYPEMLPPKIIDSINEYWIVPQGFAIRWALLAREEPMAFTHRLLGEMQFVLRILFAINHQWEPDWKWLRSEVQSLTIKPERLIERIHDIFTMAQNEQTVAQVLMLIRDTLKLVPAQYNVARALENVEESLYLHGYAIS
jgi:hypothetical protein